MNTIVCFGEALIDFLAAPQPDPAQARMFRQFAGGAPANAAVAVARLGGACEFVGMLGEDMFGDFLLHSLREAGAGTRYVRRTDRARTALAFVSLDANGERSFSFYRPPAADLLFAESDFDPACFAEAGVFHVCSNSLTEQAIATATLAGMRHAMELMLTGDHALQGDNYFYTGVEAKRKDPKAPFAMVLTAPILSFAGGMIINKNALNPYASALFVDWTLSADSQNMINEILRGPLTIKHPYLPDNVKLVTYNIVSDDITKRLHDAWGQYIGRMK